MVERFVLGSNVFVSISVYFKLNFPPLPPVMMKTMNPIMNNISIMVSSVFFVSYSKFSASKSCA